MGRGPLLQRIYPLSKLYPLLYQTCVRYSLCGINQPFGWLFPSAGQVAHVLLTRPPLNKKASSLVPLDLHVLGTPPAFVLSQDQTLNLSSFSQPVFTDYFTVLK